MPSLHFLLSVVAPIAGVPALLWCLLVEVVSRRRRRRVLRADDLTDWLLADIGWRDGRDTTARRMARQCNMPRRPLV